MSRYKIPTGPPLAEPLVEFVDEVGGFAVHSVCLKNAGDAVPQHRHEVDHITLVSTGKVRLWVNGRHIKDIAAFGVLEVKAGDEHVLQALEPMTRLTCVINTTTAQFRKLAQGD